MVETVECLQFLLAVFSAIADDNQLPVNYLLNERFKMTTIDKIFICWFPPEYYAHTTSALEFIMLKHQIIFSPRVYFAPSDISSFLLYALCNYSPCVSMSALTVYIFIFKNVF